MRQVNASLLEDATMQNSEVANTHTVEAGFDLSVDGAETSLYKAKYDERTKTYTINLNEGDGVEDSYIDVHTIKATQHGDKIKIVINPIYIDNIGEKKNEDCRSDNSTKMSHLYPSGPIDTSGM